MSASTPHRAESRTIPRDANEQPPDSLLCEISSLSPTLSLPPKPPQAQPTHHSIAPATISPRTNIPPQTLLFSRADIDTSLIYNPSTRLIDPSPPRCITPGRPFIPYDTDPPPARGVVEGLADRMSQQTLEAHKPGRENPAPPAPELNLISDSSFANPSSDFPYPVELEIDPDSENLDAWCDLVVEPPPRKRWEATSYVPNEPTACPEPTNDKNLKSEDHTATKDVKGKSTKRIMDMIQTETQCYVHEPPTPPSVAMPPIPTHLTSSVPPPPLPSVDEMSIELDDAPIELACTTLEVDENPDDDDMSWMESIVTLRRAAIPGGVRKHGLRYRASHEAALRCTNLVRSVPRMRRRKDKKSKSYKDYGSNTTGPVSSIAGTSSIQAL